VGKRGRVGLKNYEGKRLEGVNDEIKENVGRERVRLKG
jgi:hypothetical protein